MAIWNRRQQRDAARIAKLEAELDTVGKAKSFSPQTDAGNLALMVSHARNQRNASPDIPPDMLTGLQQAGMDGNPAFGPGTPISPYDGYDVRPRAYDYPPGYNITARPRTQEGRIAFSVLRDIINTYDIAQICITHIIDDLRSMDWMIQPLGGTEGELADEIKEGRKFFQRPDGVTPFDSWMSMFLEDVLRYDAGALYKRRDKAGRLIALEVVDGTSLVPLIDEHGRPPGGHEADRNSDEGKPPAFLQYIKGVPWDWLSFDQLLYLPFRPLPDSPYGMPPMEWLLLNANTDIRWQWHMLMYFTEGSMPDAFGELPPDLSNPEQVEMWQRYWDAVMEGDQAQKHKIRWVPGGTKIDPIKAEVWDEKFPLHLMRKTAAAFHVTPADLGFTDAVNKASADTQIDVQFRVGTMPRVRFLQNIFDTILQEEMGLPLVFRFDTGQEKEDRLAEAQAMDLYIKMGAQSPDEVRSKLLGLPVDPEHPVPRFIFGTRTGPIPLSAIFDAAGKVEPGTAAPDGATIDAYLSALPVTPGEAVNPNLDAQARGQQTPAGALTPGQPQPRTPSQTGPNTGNFQPTPGVLQEHRPQAVTPLSPQDAAPVGKSAPKAAGLAVRAVDTGRVLMIQRSKEEDDAAAGKWEFPGGHLENGEETNEAAVREWQEETGAQLPAGRFAGDWTSANGVYKGHVYEVPTEDTVDINKDDRSVLNPDDPDGDNVEVAAWWEPHEAQGNPAMRAELANMPWHVVTGPLVAKSTDREDVLRELRKWRDNTRSRLKKGQTPRPFESDIIPPVLSEALWRYLAAADTREAVEAVFKVAEEAMSSPKEPKTSEQWPGWRHDLQIARHYGPAISDAQRLLIGDPTSLVQDFYASQGHPAPLAFVPLSKAILPKASLQKALRWLRERFAGRQSQLDPVLPPLYSDAYAVGVHGASTVAGVPDPTALADWANWRPRNPVAVGLLLNAPGLQGLLDAAGVTIKGIDATTLESLARVLADGLAAGQPARIVAKQIGRLLDDPNRAYLIALTEASRAMNTATLDTYRRHGIRGRKQLIAGPSACALCKENAAAGCVPLDAGMPNGEAPTHPMCRCALLPCN